MAEMVSTYDICDTLEDGTEGVAFGMCDHSTGGWDGGWILIEWRKREPARITCRSGAWFLFARADVQAVLADLARAPRKGERLCALLEKHGFARYVPRRRAAPPT